MTGTRTAGAMVTMFVSWSVLFWTPTAAAAQDALARAKDLYMSAAYDEALAALTGYRPPADHAIEADEYRAFCLLALGNNDDASKIIEQIVIRDPSFVPAENQASPRVQEAFRDVRRRVMPSIVRAAYADAKSAFDRKDFDTAARQFDRVLALLKDPAASASGDLADLRMLSNSFLDLIKTASAVPAAAPAPPPSVPAPAPRLYTAEDTDVVPPAVVSQSLPAWHPSKEETQAYQITVIVVIDETGTVASVRMEGTVHAGYEAQLREAIRRWKYHPATRNGTPVKFQKAVAIRLNPADAGQNLPRRR